MLNALLVTIVLCLAPCANAFEDPKNGTDTAPPALEKARVMLREFASAPDPREWFTVNGAAVDTDVLEVATAIYKDAMNVQDYGKAGVVCHFAILGFLQIGETTSALAAAVDLQQMRFMTASDPAAYARIVEECGTIMNMARAVGANGIMFKAAVLAADSSYFASEVENDLPTRSGHYSNTMHYLTEAATYIGDCPAQTWYERFISLLCAFTTKTQDDVFFAPSSEEERGKLGRLTKLVEEAIPVDFSFGEDQIGDADKTLRCAKSLADLSYNHSSAFMGDARLALAARWAEEVGDLEDVLAITSTRYTRGLGTSLGSYSNLTRYRRLLWAVADRLREKYRSRAGRLWAGQTADLFLGDVLGDSLEQDDLPPSDALDMVEALKARSLLDEMTFGLAAPVALSGDQARTAARRLEAEALAFATNDSDNSLLSLEMQLISQLSIGHSIDRPNRQAPIDQLEFFYKQSEAGLTDVATPTSLHDLQRALETDEAIIEYCMPYHWSHPAKQLVALVVTRDAFQRVAIDIPEDMFPLLGMIGRISSDGKPPIDVSPVSDGVINLRVAIQESDEDRAQNWLRRFYRLLVRPLVDRGVRPELYRRWIVVPHGALHYVPYAALMDEDGRFLIEHVAISTVPSATIWYRLQGMQRPLLRSALLVGYTGGGDQALLREPERELAVISQLLTTWGVKRIQSPDAIETNIKTGMVNASILHFATHGSFASQDSLNLHSILLGADASNDGKLSAEEIAIMDMRSTRLATLSICNGGVYSIGPADEPYGLVRALLGAGCENVLGTLWPVEDEFARAFMEEYYRHILAMGPAEAMRASAMSFIQEQELIRRWAGFVSVGVGRRFE